MGGLNAADIAVHHSGASYNSSFDYFINIINKAMLKVTSKKIIVLGLSFKNDVADIKNSMEIAAPFIEFLSYMLVITGILLEIISWFQALFFILIAWGFLLLLTLSNFFLDRLTFNISLYDK
tara:strand:- start:8208 stop:8573 length:366 start_codon:yes stop_codon:yes gene_type:complete